MNMHIAHDRALKEVAEGKVAIDNRNCGDLFELRSVLIPPNTSINLEFSPLINLVMMVSGSADVNFNQTLFGLNMGQVWLVNFSQECELHNTDDAQDAVVLSVLIKPTMLSRFYGRYDLKDAVKTNKEPLDIIDSVLGKEKAPIVFPSCELTRLTLESFRLFNQYHDDGLNALKLEELLLLKLKGDHGDILAEEMLNTNDPAQEKLRRFMEQNITRNWSVAEYAKSFGMSLTAFKNLFSQVYGKQPPKSWINHQRLNYADVQLKTSSSRLIDIALDSGFSSQSYFTQLYKSHYGISPSEARQK